ncbi:MAG: DNA/RNA non-specific endonuclease [Bacteroidetes bacterium]|nr:DNA/RNA non-specific endonuclease [Bacteroidota bacterium]
MKRRLSILSIVVTFVLLPFWNNGYSQTHSSRTSSGVNLNMWLGNPSNATTDTINQDNYLMVKPQYTLSYNNTKHIPNWVSWHVDSTDLGDFKRNDRFQSDNTLPVSWYHVKPSDYAGTGFDKGHQCPSADRTYDSATNEATFLMTNMIPQAPKNNEIVWKNLEDYCRTLVQSHNELYIICGVSGQGGIGKKGAASSIKKGIVVPAQTWKIIVVVPSKLHVVTDSTRVISVLIPNTQDCSKQRWDQYRVSIDSIEKITKYDFLSSVPVAIQKVIEARVDNGPVN